MDTPFGTVAARPQPAAGPSRTGPSHPVRRSRGAVVVPALLGAVLCVLLTTVVPLETAGAQAQPTAPPLPGSTYSPLPTATPRVVLPLPAASPLVLPTATRPPLVVPPPPGARPAPVGSPAVVIPGRAPAQVPAQAPSQGAAQVPPAQNGAAQVPARVQATPGSPLPVQIPSVGTAAPGALPMQLAGVGLVFLGAGAALRRHGGLRTDRNV